MTNKPSMSKEEIAARRGKSCFCANCGHENGYNKDRLLKLFITKNRGDENWNVFVSFGCELCNCITDFFWETTEDPSEWQAAINLYGTIVPGEPTLSEVEAQDSGDVPA